MEQIGNVDVKGGEGRVYTLNFGVNAMCRLEDLTGRAYHEVLMEMKKGLPSMKTIRQFVQAALVAPPAESPEQAGTIIEDIGGAASVLLAFARSDAGISQAFLEEQRGAPRPPRKGRRG